MTTLRTPIAIVVLGLAVLAGLTACGGSGGSATTSSPGAAAAGKTVSQTDVSGVGTILVDANGDALDSPDQEAGGTILCTGSCTAIWIPLTLSSGETTPTGVDGLALVRRPDGSQQVTYRGAPLYTFAEDTTAGEVKGDGLSDSFGGTDFTWHVAGGGSTSSGSGTGTGSYRY
jgi:predicted lipoprotein with Yx(FWY)xxD motif